VIIKVAYGYQIEDVDDDLVRIIQEGMAGTSELNRPGKYLVEVFPFCALLMHEIFFRLLIRL